MVTSSSPSNDRPSDVSSSDAETVAEKTFEVRGGLEQIRSAVDMLAGLFAQTPLTARDVKDFRHAVMEMVDNAVEWGHRRDFDRIVWIDYRVGHDAVTVTVRDQGPGFNHGMGKGTDRSSWPSHTSTFGILLTIGLVDEIFYNDRGNEVTLIKRFPREPLSEEGPAEGSGSPGDSKRRRTRATKRRRK